MTTMTIGIKELDTKQLENASGGGLSPVTAGNNPPIKVKFSKAEYFRQKEEQKKKQEELGNQ